MLEKYQTLEKEVESINDIDSWTEKVIKMKELREKITLEQQNLTELLNIIFKNEINKEETKKKKNKMDLDTLVNKFNETSSLEDKIKIYQMITYQINDIEKQLFE